MTSTAPIKTEINATRGIEFITSLSASEMHCLKKIPHFSGFLKVLFIRRKYWPVSVSNLFIYNFFIDIKCSFYLIKVYKDSD